MTVLWIAFGFYIVGIALVLYYRPTIMFRPDGGAWKEFGLSTKGSYTVFPFWLFTVIWAFGSYVLATLSTVFMASLAMRSIRSEPTMHAIANSIQPEMPTQLTMSPQQLQPHPQPQPQPLFQRPGYYVLDSRPSGPPKYVYFGSEPPKYGEL